AMVCTSGTGAASTGAGSTACATGAASTAGWAAGAAATAVSSVLVKPLVSPAWATGSASSVPAAVMYSAAIHTSFCSMQQMRTHCPSPVLPVMSYSSPLPRMMTTGCDVSGPVRELTSSVLIV